MDTGSDSDTKPKRRYLIYTIGVNGLALVPFSY